MRFALFSTTAGRCAVALDKVLHVLPAPTLFVLPLMRVIFSGVIIHQDQLVPVLAPWSLGEASPAVASNVPLILLCEAEFGRLGIPVSQIERITADGELPDPSGEQNQDGILEVSGVNYRLLDLNRLLDASRNIASQCRG